MNAVWGVLPVKDLADAKTRLAPVLTREERHALFPLMVEDVLAAMAASSLAGTLVLTNDGDATALAARHGARVMGEPENSGQTAAVTRAVDALADEGIGTVCTLPGDLPIILASEIDEALALHRSAVSPAMTIVPAWDRRGSNCLILSPPGLIPFSFGNESFEPHLGAARAAGVEPAILPLEGIGLDVDEPGDLLMALRIAERDGRGGRAIDWIRSTDLPRRLAEFAREVDDEFR